MNISIIIPTYNNLKSLKLVLHSIYKQTLKPKNIIIIDSSTNNLIEKYINIKKSKIKIYFRSFFNYYKFNDGFPGHSRNLGIEFSDTDYIAFLVLKSGFFHLNYVRVLRYVFLEKYQLNNETQMKLHIMNLH